VINYIINKFYYEFPIIAESTDCTVGGGIYNSPDGAPEFL
jgi:hypothetical protein